MKKILMVLLVLLMAASLFAGGKKEAETEKPQAAEEKVEVKTEMAKPAIKNPDTYIWATYGTIDSLDPAKSYDSASWANMALLYETLVTYKGESTGDFIPVLAEEVPTIENGLVTNGGKTWKFKIKKGIKFHSGDTMTPEDVEYSFERNMVLDPDAGPNWIWYYIFFDGVWGSRDDDGNVAVDFADIDKAVEVEGDYVVFNLANPFPAFLGVIAGKWAAIVNKSFVAENGGWDGSAATYPEVNNPPEDAETLQDIEDGTGPYRMVRWEKGVEMVHQRFEDYWGNKPALRKVIYKVVDEWSTRKLMLLRGDVDVATVDSLYYNEMDQEEGLTVYKDLPSLTVHGVFFNQDIAAQDNPLIGSGKIDGEGVPPDFFADKNIRLGFIYAFDESIYINDISNNTAMDPVTPIPAGLPYKNPDQKRLPHDMKKAEEAFRKAFGGQVWEQGFKIDLLYNEGNDVRRAVNMMLAENVMKLNPKFKVSVRGVEWSEYVDMIRKSNMPIFNVGWAPDYPDPDNYANPFMHSQGHYARQVGYSNPEVDKLVEEAAISFDPALRKKNYYRIQEIFIEDAVGIMYSQPLSRRYFKDWIKGWYFNPMMSHDEFETVPFLTKSY